MDTVKLNKKLHEKIADLIGDTDNKYIKSTVYKNTDTQWITLHYIDEKDYPNNIEQNSIYLQFRIDYVNNTVCCTSCGHIWLTPEDQKKSYLAMTSIKNIVKYDKEKWFRKQKFKSIDDLADKISDFYFTVFGIINMRTAGYPYKYLTINIY